jgi:hypothetical protein
MHSSPNIVTAHRVYPYTFIPPLAVTLQEYIDHAVCISLSGRFTSKGIVSRPLHQKYVWSTVEFNQIASPIPFQLQWTPKTLLSLTCVLLFTLSSIIQITHNIYVSYMLVQNKQSSSCYKIKIRKRQTLQSKTTSDFPRALINVFFFRIHYCWDRPETKGVYRTMFFLTMPMGPIVDNASVDAASKQWSVSSDTCGLWPAK